VRIETSESAPAHASTNGTGTKRKAVLVGYGTDDAMDASRRRAPAPESERPRAKPPVRKLAAELHVDLAALAPGSGPEGIITRDDVLAAAGGAELLDVRGVQAEMARRMTLAHREIPDAHARVEVDCAALLALRDRMAAADETLAVTPFVLTLRMLVIALRRHPMLNSTWVVTDERPRIHQHAAVHLGFGVATPRGLLVPVVANAQDLTTRQLAQTVSRLIDGARAGSLQPRQLTGSTFTVSNYGALGLDDGVPVINYPEAAILGMGSVKPRAVVVDGAVTARPTMALTCVFDHRIADGAQAAAFLVELRDLIEAPALALSDL
jgi:2-oxoisovalerate dehydrogenase E2 component (dihydrolipoyl transacylase)